MIVIDSSVIYALLDRNHRQAAAWYLENLPTLATTPLILAEVDHLARGVAVVHCRIQTLNLFSYVYDVVWRKDATRQTVKIAAKYSDLGVGLADASLVMLATRLETTAIATFDERLFRAMRPEKGGDAFRLLPADS